jgi:hypothetical protein
MSAPLDEIALHYLYRESTSASSVSSDTQPLPGEDSKPRQASKQDIIAAQRPVARPNQRTIVSAQTNSLRGVDVVLPGNAVIRSSRYEVEDRMRYSYVLPNGETYDISDLIGEEWSESNVQKDDPLEDILTQKKDRIGDKLDRILGKIKNEKGNPQTSITQSNSTSMAESNINSIRATSTLEYSVDDRANEEAMNSRASTPVFIGRSPTPTSGGTLRAMSPLVKGQSPNPDSKNRSRTSTPTMQPSKISPGASRRQPSIALVMSDLAGDSTLPAALTPRGSPRGTVIPKPQRRRPINIPEDDFGISHMNAIIEYAGSTPKTVLPPVHPVDELLYGRKFDIGSLHPDIRDIYSDSFKKLDDMDKASSSKLW